MVHGAPSWGGFRCALLLQIPAPRYGSSWLHTSISEHGQLALRDSFLRITPEHRSPRAHAHPTCLVTLTAHAARAAAAVPPVPAAAHSSSGFLAAQQLPAPPAVLARQAHCLCCLPAAALRSLRLCHPRCLLQQARNSPHLQQSLAPPHRSCAACWLAPLCLSLAQHQSPSDQTVLTLRLRRPVCCQCLVSLGCPPLQHRPLLCCGRCCLWSSGAGQARRPAIPAAPVVEMRGSALGIHKMDRCCPHAFHYLPLPSDARPARMRTCRRATACSRFCAALAPSFCAAARSCTA